MLHIRMRQSGVYQTLIPALPLLATIMKSAKTAEHTTINSIMGFYMLKGPLNKLGGPFGDFLLSI